MVDTVKSSLAMNSEDDPDDFILSVTNDNDEDSDADRDDPFDSDLTSEEDDDDDDLMPERED